MSESTLAKTSSGFKVKTIVLIGLMTAVTCVLGPLSVPLPFSPVPISLTNLAIYFTVYVIGTKRGTMSYLIYLLIGFVGVPVFSAFTSGPGKLLGATGTIVCYLFGTVWLAYQAGMSIQAAALAGVIPFIPGDIVKILLAVMVGPQIRKRLYAAGLNESKRE